MKHEELNIVKRLFRYATLLAAVLLTACSGNEAADTELPLPEGKGCIRLTICSPENGGNNTKSPITRAVNATPWEDPDHEWEKLQTFRILICKASDNKVVQIISGDKSQMSAATTLPSTFKSATVTSQPLEAGNYYIYATANFDDGYSVGDTFNPDATVKFANGYSEKNIPMTGKLMETNGTLKSVAVSNGTETDAGTITVWRVMGKLSFEFTNETSEQVQILGIEVEPINQASTTGPGIYLFSKDNLASEANLVPLFPANTTKTVSATWALDAVPTQDGAATVSLGGVFASTALSWGSKVTVPTDNPTVTTYDKAYTLRKFSVNNNTSSQDEEAVISFKVTPATGMSFTPKNISFKVCRGATDGGKFDVVAGGTTLATGVTPPRYNGTGGSSGTHEPPFYQEYSYAISASETTGEYVVNIYLYNLNQREYAFRDIVISGDVTNNTGAALQEHISLPTGALTDVGPVSYAPATALTLGANGSSNATGTLFFYVNETDASFTTTNNQFSIRLKIRRGSHTEELRYGMTTPYIDGTTGGNGFNVIRRNDWIHIPIHLTDWQFRVEPLAFVPIGGYPATMLSSDALTATFSTGGYIILQPFAQKNNDGTWRDFTDKEVTFVSLTWKNSDGTNVSGTGKIFETAPTYDAASGRILGVLNNSLAAGTYKTSVTVNVKLGPSGSQYDYAFTFNVVLQK